MESRARVRESIRRTAVLGIGTLSVLVGATGVSSCGNLTRQGTASSYLIVTELVAAPGAEPDKFGAVLYSDVETIVDDVPTIFSDLGRVSFALVLKDPGTSANPAAPTPNNFITVNRYRVRYIRADGRNTPGVDVPYGFDGAMTITVRDEMSSSFELVRHMAKEEAPLAALRRNATIIGTLAEVTFFGHDQTGREVSIVGRIAVEFGNFADPS